MPGLQSVNLFGTPRSPQGEKRAASALLFICRARTTLRPVVAGAPRGSPDGPFIRSRPTVESDGGRYWIRTSDLLHVKQAL